MNFAISCPITFERLTECGRVLIPVNIDKRPLGPWAEFQKRAPSPAETAAWRAQQPVAWGMVTGAISRVITLDFDGPAGVETLKGLGIEPHRKTGSGGFHVDFAHPGWPVKTLNGKSKRELGARWPGLDIRGDGGYVVVLGRNRNGDYQWLRAVDPYPLEILPVEVRAFLGLLNAPEVLPHGDPAEADEPQKQVTSAPAEADEPQKPSTSAPAEGAQGSGLPFAWQRVSFSTGVEPVDSRVLLLLGMAFESVKELGRDNAGFNFCIQMRDNGYSATEIAKFGPWFVERANEITGTTNTKGIPEPYTLGDFTKSLHSAFRRPAREPWDVPKNEPEDGDEGEGEISGMSVDADEPDGDAGPECQSQASSAGRGAEPEASDVDPEPAAACAEDFGTEQEPGDAERDAVAETNGDQPAKRAPGTVATAAQQKKARDTLKFHLKLDVARVVKFGETDGLYQLQLLDGRTADLGRADKFSSERRFRTAVIDGLSLQLPRFKQGGWRKCLDAMLAVLEVRPGFSDEQMATEWVETFLSIFGVEIPSLTDVSGTVALAFDALNGLVQEVGRSTGAIYESRPGGQVVIKLRLLYQYLCRDLNVRLSQPDLAVLLGKIGFRRVSTLNGPVWKGDRLRLQRVWTAPRSRFQFVPRQKMRIAEFDDERYLPDQPDVVRVVQ